MLMSPEQVNKLKRGDTFVLGGFPFLFLGLEANGAVMCHPVETDGMKRFELMHTLYKSDLKADIQIRVVRETGEGGFVMIARPEDCRMVPSKELMEMADDAGRSEESASK
jgi:hypothetical protein